MGFRDSGGRGSFTLAISFAGNPTETAASFGRPPFFSCEVLFACNGECPKHRFAKTPAGEAGLNYLCAAKLKYFAPWHREGLEEAMIPESVELLASLKGKPVGSAGKITFNY